MFRVKFVTCGSVPPARYVFANSVAAAEGYSEQQKQGCELDNSAIDAVPSAPQPHCVLIGLQSEGIL